MTLLVNSLGNDELKQIAHLHAENISQGFISSLGLRFLFALYDSIQRADGGVLVACRQDGVISGFVSGTLQIGPVYKMLILRHPFTLAYVFLTRAFTLRKMKRILETFLYTSKDNVNEQAVAAVPSVELLSLAVDKNFRRQGIAEKLCFALEDEFRKRGCSEYKIMVGDSLLGAQKFYESIGAQKIYQTSVHAGETSWIYVKKLT